MPATRLRATVGASRAGVLGRPIAHSLSPVLYRAGFAAAGLDGWSFDAVDCGADELPAVLAESGAEWRGYAVTMPGKAAAAAAADSRSERVTTLGVANTLLRRTGGWHAENTDVDGVIGALAASGVPPRGEVLLVGGGGTARAVLAALAGLGWDGTVTVAGRRPESTERALAIAATLGIHARHRPIDPVEMRDAARRAQMVVSTVPAGAIDELAPVFASVPAMFDVIYHPWPTPLAAAGAPGRTTVTGLDMLLHQAIRQFELVTGVAAPAAAMRDALRSATGTLLPLPVGPGDEVG